MSDEYQTQPEGQQERPRRSFQQYPQRSAASVNWRQKDDAPRADPQPRRGRGDNAGFSSRPRGPVEGEVSSTRLYVGNLLYSATKDDIAAFFGENGFNFTNISMSIDPLTGRNPSYCFVDLETADDASKAMAELNGQDVMGRTVRISPGVARKQGEGSFQERRGGFGGERRGGYQNGQQEYEPRTYNSPSSKPSWSAHNATTTERSGNENSKRLYIGSLPETTTTETIETLFAHLSIPLVNVSKLITPHESKKELPGDHHYLFAELESSADADRAIVELDGKVVDGVGPSTLKVNKARERERTEREGGGFGGRGRGGYGYSGRGDGTTGYQSRRTEGARDWRTAQAAQEQI